MLTSGLWDSEVSVRKVQPKKDWSMAYKSACSNILCNWVPFYLSINWVVACFNLTCRLLALRTVAGSWVMAAMLDSIFIMRFTTVHHDMSIDRYRLTCRQWWQLTTIATWHVPDDDNWWQRILVAIVMDNSLWQVRSIQIIYYWQFIAFHELHGSCMISYVIVTCHDNC